MSDELSTSSSVRNVDSAGERVLHWVLLSGNRILLAAGIVAVVFALVYGSIRLGFATVGPRSFAATAFASGLISGTITLVTIALSINQLILSRVFGSPNELRDRLDGTRVLRERVRDLSGEPTTPNDPAEFLGLIATTLRDRAQRLGSTLEAGDWDPPAAVEEYVRDVDAYGESIDSAIEGRTAIVNVLGTILGTEYARNLTATEHLRNAYAEDISPASERELDAIEELIESIAVTRQFFKTLSLQQDFARLSRVVAYAGLVALLASLLLTLVYRTNSVTVPLSLLPAVFSVGIAVVISPLSVFISYVLRASTVARRTVSVGPFIPPEERSDGN